MIILGIILLIIGFIAKIAIFWTIGIIVLVVGLILRAARRSRHGSGRAPPLLLTALLALPRRAARQGPGG